MDYSRDEDGLPRKERELTLSMSAILVIFFGLVLLCGLFFGLGYNVRGRQIVSAAIPDPALENSTDPAFNNFKPAAGSPAGSKPTVVVAPGANPSNQTVIVDSSSASPANAHAATPANTATATSTTPQPAPIVRLAPAPTGHTGPTGNSQVSATVTTPAQLSGGPAPSSAPASSYLVQVAAVSHKEDADLLMGALKGRGYSVNARTESQDKLIHIQIGPFSNHKDAEAMRQRLLSDGYNAIIK